MKTMYDERKFTELLVYVAGRLQRDRSGGATKLNTVLFFVDFAHIRRTGSPISGAIYRKLKHGPAARRLRPVRDQLISTGEAELPKEQFLGCQHRVLVRRRRADLTVFTQEELDTIDRVLADLDGLNARQVGDLSHEEAGWRLVDFGDDNPHEAASAGARQVSTPTSQRLEREAAERFGRVAT